MQNRMFNGNRQKKIRRHGGSIFTGFPEPENKKTGTGNHFRVPVFLI
jgi:hypothetical protein